MQVAGMRSASASAVVIATARSPVKRAPTRRSWAAMPSGTKLRKPAPAKPSPSGPLFLGACGSPAVTSGR